MPKVFVYGTLKQGFPLHAPSGMPQAQLIGLYETEQAYPVVIAGPWYGPMMFDEPGHGLIVRGELYLVGEDALPALDEAEHVGEPGSFRSTLRVRPLSGGAVPVDAIGFMKSREIADPIHSDYVGDYQDRRFVPPWDRP